jgi:hypothetical protein
LDSIDELPFVVYTENMSTLPRTKINEYYNQFRQIDVVFTREVIEVTGLLGKMVNLKCVSDFFPCVIYSTSFEVSKIVANNKSGIMEKLKQTNNNVSLRFCFKIPATNEEVAFLIPSRVIGMSPYDGSQDMTLFQLQFSQRPPDDLIEIMGRILNANYHYSKNKKQLFPITADALRKMRFMNKETVLTVEDTAYKCLLRDLGFGCARFIVKGTPKSLLEKHGSIRFDFVEPKESIIIEGSFDKRDPVADNPDINVITMFFEDPVQMSFKTRLCDYITTIKFTPQKQKENASSEAAEVQTIPAQAEKEEPSENTDTGIST